MVLLLSFPTPTEGVRHKEEHISVNVDGTQLQETGTVFITESCVAWQTGEGKGFTLLYPDISLHAISRDLNAFPHECLYLMIDGKLPEENRERNNSSSSEEEEDCVVTELRFVPADKGSLDLMFNVMSDCQALHPDEQDTDSEAEEESDVIYYESQVGADHLTPDGQATLQHLEHLLLSGAGDGQVNTAGQQNGGQGDDRFEDAEDNMEQ